MSTQTLCQVIHRLRHQLGSASSLSDAELLSQVQTSRNSQALEAIVERHGPTVLAACRTVLGSTADVDDAFQATFLIFFRSCTSIRKQNSLGAWLFGVARRVSIKIRAQRDRLARAERQMAPMVPEMTTDITWREACAILHEELDRLDEKYRVLLILSYLEGLSRDDIAEALGLKFGTVKRRLEEGRLRLRNRLMRRGVTLSAGLLSSLAVLADKNLFARLVAPVLSTSHQANPIVQKAVAAVTNQTLSRVTMGSCIAVVLLPVLWTILPVNRPAVLSLEHAEVPKEIPVTKELKALLSGRVVDQDGQGMARAKVSCIARDLESPGKTIRLEATTKEDGEFVFNEWPGKAFDGDTRELLSQLRFFTVARKEGYSLGLPLNLQEDSDRMVIRLQKDDRPIKGRIVDLQGKPIAGVEIQATQLLATNDDRLDGWLAAVKQKDRPAYAVQGDYFRRMLLDPHHWLPNPITSDAGGNFEIKGLGANRLVRLQLKGPKIATNEILVMTSSEPDVTVPTDRGQSVLGNSTYYSAQFSWVAEATQVIEGTITDSNGRRLKGVVVRSVNALFSCEATTDRDGHYRLVGLPAGSHEIVAIPPGDQPLLPFAATAGRTRNHEPILLDLQLSVGQWLTGTVTNSRDHKPIPRAEVRYSPGTVVNAKSVGRGEAFDEWSTSTDDEGKFRIAALPGKGYVAVSGASAKYMSASYRFVQGEGLFQSYDQVMTQWPKLFFTSTNALAIVQVKPEKAKEYSITLDPGDSMHGTLVDVKGKNLLGVNVSGRSEHEVWSKALPTEKFELTQMDIAHPRTVLFWNGEAKVGASFTPRLGAKVDYKVTLKPLGKLNGMIVDANDQSVAELPLEVSVMIPNHRSWTAWTPTSTIRTDAKGQFVLENLVEDVEYSIRGSLKVNGSENRIYRVIKVKSGETKDLGVIRPQR